MTPEELRKDLAVALSALAPNDDQECEVWRCVEALIRAAERDTIERCAKITDRESRRDLSYKIRALASDPAFVPKEEKKP